MPELTADRLARALGIPKDRAERWAPHLDAVMRAYRIDSPVRQAAFLAQVAHETAGLTKLVEDLDYSTHRLMDVWPGRFRTVDKAVLYAHNPENLANFVYANRMGNGDEASGDGWRFRGRGLAMLTWRSNYLAFGQATTDRVGLPDRFVQFPDHVAEDDLVSAASAAWFWDSRRMNDFADAGDFEAVSRRWNGGDIGMQHRLALTERAIGVLA